MLRSLSPIVLTLLAGLVTVSVRADQGALQEARELYWEARFDDALAALGRAEQGDDLTREDLIALYELRAQAHLGSRDDEGLQEALTHLAVLDPDHEFDRAIPPDVVSRFAEVKTAAPPRISIEARVVPTPTGAQVEATLSEDPLGLVRDVRVHARAPGAEWQTGASPLAVDAGTIEHFAEAVGPGGAVIAAAGSAEAPLTDTVGLPPPEPLEVPAAPESAEDSGTEIPWLWVGAGAGALVVVVVLVAILASGGEDTPDSLQPSLPMQVEF